MDLPSCFCGTDFPANGFGRPTSNGARNRNLHLQLDMFFRESSMLAPNVFVLSCSMFFPSRVEFRTWFRFRCRFLTMEYLTLKIVDRVSEYLQREVSDEESFGLTNMWLSYFSFHNMECISKSRKIFSYQVAALVPDIFCRILFKLNRAKAGNSAAIFHSFNF